jgi:hypothetical protein
MAGWYQTYIAGTGRSAALWALIGFLTTYCGPSPAEWLSS